MATELVAGAATALAVYTLVRQRRSSAPVAQECSRAAMVEVETEAAPVGFRQTLAYFQQILRWV
jgi:hypothetical protein